MNPALIQPLYAILLPHQRAIAPVVSTETISITTKTGYSTPLNAHLSACERIVVALYTSRRIELQMGAGEILSR